VRYGFVQWNQLCISHHCATLLQAGDYKKFMTAAKLVSLLEIKMYSGDNTK